MEALIELFNEYKSIILLSGGLALLAYIVYKLCEFITREANTVVIELENKVSLAISIYEDGRTSMNISYPEHLKKLFKGKNKTKLNGTYNDFLDSLPKEYVIEYVYELEYITEKETYKRNGSTENIDEIRTKIEKLIKYK